MAPHRVEECLQAVVGGTHARTIEGRGWLMYDQLNIVFVKDKDLTPSTGQISDISGRIHQPYISYLREVLPKNAD